MSHALQRDPTSLANPLDVKVVSSHLALKVDFTKKILSGYVDHKTEVLKDGSSTFVLDSKAINISKVSLVAQAEEAVEYKMGTPSEVFGVPLEITIPEKLRSAGSVFTARVHYETTSGATALQWLDPKQTAGKVHPYLFSQCQAIHARSLVPCQDTPSNKIKYTAAITVSTPLTALMSATPTGTPTTSANEATFNFVQDVPIPTYLIAIAVGHLESREIGPRSKVWSEPEMVEKGAYEFANTEKFIKTGEDLLTPYVWGRYDILLLPPSFPYGGMENPQLTFVTPTLLAGDRSLENVVAHEIAHSWMGNLVTNRYWSEFFLNEGFTVFVERKILARMNNVDYFDFEALGGLKHLHDDVSHFGAENPLTALRPKMDGIDPDDAFSSVPYEKGFNLLCYLQSLVGVEKFEAWLKAYVTKFQYQSITADQMKDFFLASFTDVPALKNIDWDSWFDKPGMPIVKNEFSTKLADSAIALAKRWVADGSKGSSASDLKDFSSGQKVTFIDQLLALTEEKPLSAEVIADLEKLYSFTETKNSEIRLRWYQLCIKSNYTSIFPHVIQFLTEQGRMKFVRPLYRELHKHPQGKQLAVNTFKAHRESYHSIAANMLAKDLGLSK